MEKERINESLVEFERKLGEDLHKYLMSVGRIDERLPECPDLEELWPKVAKAYIPDGVKEYNGHPLVSLGWMMFIGMAMARFWDEDWEKYSRAEVADLYKAMKEAKGFDNLDDHVLEELIGVDKSEAEEIGRIVGECASRTEQALRRSGFEPGTSEALHAWLAAEHQLFLMGIYMELNALGYHLTRM